MKMVDRSREPTQTPGDDAGWTGPVDAPVVGVALSVDGS